MDNSQVKENQLGDFKLCRECMLHHSGDVETVHCFECGVCIENYDHHCPWTGKCIGKYTLWTFYGFVFGTLALFVFLLFGLIFLDPHSSY